MTRLMAVLGLVTASLLLASCEMPGSTPSTDTASGSNMETVSTGSNMDAATGSAVDAE
jgi:uncharacterized lipoprotein YajG